MVDPARIRFQHSRIRPHFSGCGRHLHDTLDSIRSGELRAGDLPPIQVRVEGFQCFGELMLQRLHEVCCNVLMEPIMLLLTFLPLRPRYCYSNLVRSTGVGGSRNRRRPLVFLIEQSTTMGLEAMPRRRSTPRQPNRRAGSSAEKCIGNFSLYGRKLRLRGQAHARDFQTRAKFGDGQGASRAK